MEQEHIILPREHMPAEQVHISCEYLTSERRQTTLLCITSAYRTKRRYHARMCCSRTYIINGTSSWGTKHHGYTSMRNKDTDVLTYEHTPAEQEHSLLTMESHVAEWKRQSNEKNSFCTRRTQCNNIDCSAMRTGISCTDTWRRLTSTYHV